MNKKIVWSEFANGISTGSIKKKPMFFCEQLNDNKFSVFINKGKSEKFSSFDECKSWAQRQITYTTRIIQEFEKLYKNKTR